MNATENGISTPNNTHTDDSSTLQGNGNTSPDREMQEKQQLTDDEYPDGGWRAWLVVLGAWCVSFSTFGYANAFGVYQDYYQIHQLSDRSESDISWVGSIQLFFLNALGIFVGRLFDAGYLRHLIFTGTLVLSFAIMMVSLSDEYYQFILSQGILQGIGYGLIFIPAISTVNHWFKKRRVTALGILSTGSSIGGIVLPILNNECFKRPSIGFGWGVRATGFMIFGLLIISNFTLKTRLPPRKKGPLIDFTVFKDIPYTFFCVGCFFVMLGLYLPYFYTPSYITYWGMSKNLSFYSISILNAASIIGRTVTNFAADYVGPQNVLIPCVYTSAILIFGWIGATNTPGMIVFLILYGISSGAYVSIIPGVVAGLTPQMNMIGVRIGMCFLLLAIAALFGTPIMGAIVRAHDGKYWGAAIFSGISVLIGSILMTIGRALHAKRKGTQRV